MCVRVLSVLCVVAAVHLVSSAPGFATSADLVNKSIVNTAFTTPSIVNTASTTSPIVNTASTTPSIINTASTTPSIVNTASTTPSIVNTASITNTTSNPLAPILGKKFGMTQCKDLELYLIAAGYPEKFVKRYVHQLSFEETLSESNDFFTISIDVYFPSKETEIESKNKIFTEKSQFRLGEETERTLEDGEVFKFTVTQDGNTLTERWAMGEEHGTTVKVYNPEEIKIVTNFEGNNYHCSYTPV